MIRRAVVVALLAVALFACSEVDGSDPRPRTTEAPEDDTTTSLDVVHLSLDAGWRVCSSIPDQIYADAGTRDPAAAAEWYGLGTVERFRWASIEGCLAGLLGEPNPAGP